MAKQSSGQQRTVKRVMHEYKHGELESNRGGKVKSRRQAVAIALSEAGSSRNQSPSENRRQRARTKTKERRGQTAQQREGRPPSDGAEPGRRPDAGGAVSRGDAAEGSRPVTHEQG